MTLEPTELPFDATNPYVGAVVGRSQTLDCWAVYKTQGRTSRALLQRTSYAVDAANITMTAEPKPWQRIRIPLLNEDNGVAPKGTPADWELVCWTSMPLKRTMLEYGFEKRRVMGLSIRE